MEKCNIPFLFRFLDIATIILKAKFFQIKVMQLMFKLDKVLIIFLSPILFYIKSPALCQTLRQDEASFCRF